MIKLLLFTISYLAYFYTAISTLLIVEMIVRDGFIDGFNDLAVAIFLSASLFFGFCSWASFALDGDISSRVKVFVMTILYILPFLSLFII